MLDAVRIVLLNPSHPGNIGAIARAMKNMGLRDLALVAPDRFPDPQAEARAAAAADLLAGARVVADLDAAVGDCHVVIGTSSRSRTLPWPVLEPRELAARLSSDYRGRRTAIVFGREERGLSNSELQRCNLHVQIPADPAYPVLNLAMAVQIIAYEIHLQARNASPSGVEDVPDQRGPLGPAWDEDAATVDDVEHFLRHLEATLVQTGFHDPDNPRQLMARLRRLYQRVHLDKMEVNILRGMLKAMQQRLDRRA